MVASVTSAPTDDVHSQGFKRAEMCYFWEMDVYHEILWNIIFCLATTWMVSPETSVKTKRETRQVIVQLALEMIPHFQDSSQKDDRFMF